MKDKDTPTLQAAAAEVAAAQRRADAAETQLTEAKARADAAEGRVAGLEARIQQLESTRIDEGELTKYKNMVTAQTDKIKTLEARCDALAAPERLRKAVKERVAIEGAASIVLGAHMVTDSMDDRTLMCAVIEKLNGTSVDTERSDDYVRARFDAAVEGFKSCGDTLTKLAGLITQPTTEVRADSKSARQKMIDHNQNAWKGEKSA